MEVKIIKYQPELKIYFKEFNVAWLEKYFYVEDYDNEVLSNPEKYILDKGGMIYFLLENEIPTGTFALMYNSLNELELTKMGMKEDAKGKGYGNEMLKYCIEEVKKEKHKELILYSNTSLGPAIHLYKKYGFQEIPIDCTEYERCNIKMKLKLEI